MANDKTVTVEIKGNASSYSKSMKQVRGQTELTAKVTKKLLIGAAAAATAAIAAISAVTVASIKNFSKFQNEMLGVKTLLDETSFGAIGLEKGFAKLSKETLKLAKDSTSSISELNKALFDTVSAGIDASKAVKTLAVSNKLAIAGITSVSVATDGLTSALNAYGRSAEEADKIAAQFFTAQKFGKTTVEELSSGFGLVGASASEMGVSLEELLGSVAAVTTAGVRTKAAYTGLKAVLSNISKPTAEAAEEAARLGISFNAASLRTQHLEKFLLNLTKAQGFTKDSVTKLFGSVEAQNIIFALTGSQAKNFSRNVRELGDEQKLASTFTEALNTQSSSLEVRQKKLSNAIEVLSIRYGQYLAPSVEKVYGWVLKLVNVGDKLITGIFGSEQEKRIQQIDIRMENLSVGLGRMTKRLEEVKKEGEKGFLSKLFSADARSAKQLETQIAGVNESLKKLKTERDAITGEDGAGESKGEKSQKEIDAEKAKNEKLKEEQIRHDEEMANLKVQNDERKKAFDEEFQSLDDEQKTLLREKDLEELQSKLLTEQEAKRAVAKEELADKIASRNQFLKDEVKYGTAIAKMKQFFSKDEVKGVKDTSAQLMALQNSKNATMKAIGKRAAQVNAAMATAEGAIKAYTSLAGIPLVGPALGAAAAAALVVYGLEQQKQIQAAAGGGVIRNLNGGSNLGDSQLSMLQPKEFVTPVDNFDEVIGSTRALREAEKVGGGIGGGGGELTIGFQDENAADVLTIQDNENESLGISRRIA